MFVWWETNSIHQLRNKYDSFLFDLAVIPNYSTASTWDLFLHDTQQGHHPTLRQVGFLKALLECLHLPAMMGSISKPWIPSFWLQLVPPPPHLGGMGWEQKKEQLEVASSSQNGIQTSWPSTSKLLQVSCRKFLCHFLLRHSARPPPNPQTSRLFEGAARVLAFASHDGIHFQTLDPFFLASTCATTTSLLCVQVEALRTRDLD